MQTALKTRLYLIYCLVDFKMPQRSQRSSWLLLQGWDFYEHIFILIRNSTLLKHANSTLRGFVWFFFFFPRAIFSLNCCEVQSLSARLVLVNLYCYKYCMFCLHNCHLETEPEYFSKVFIRLKSALKLAELVDIDF